MSCKVHKSTNSNSDSETDIITDRKTDCCYKQHFTKVIRYTVQRDISSSYQKIIVFYKDGQKTKHLKKQHNIYEGFLAYKLENKLCSRYRSIVFKYKKRTIEIIKYIMYATSPVYKFQGEEG